jgi:two-component system cell cycle sensor histidine kinase/response regulator CckA
MLLLDIIMPEMMGTEFYKKIADVNKDIPVLFVSGYAKDSTQIEILLKPHVGFLQKPFTAPELIEKVNTLLNNSKKLKNNER